jgi:hypothetical protein
MWSPETFRQALRCLLIQAIFVDLTLSLKATSQEILRRSVLSAFHHVEPGFMLHAHKLTALRAASLIATGGAQSVLLARLRLMSGRHQVRRALHVDLVKLPLLRVQWHAKVVASASTLL